AEEQLAAHFAFELGRVAAARVAEGQGVERVQYRVAAGVAAVAGFHPDDGHDQFGRHAGVGLDLVQRDAVPGQERAATVDAGLADEQGPVFGPRLDPLGRARHRVDHAV